MGNLPNYLLLTYLPTHLPTYLPTYLPTSLPSTLCYSLSLSHSQKEIQNTNYHNLDDCDGLLNRPVAQTLLIDEAFWLLPTYVGSLIDFSGIVVTALLTVWSLFAPEYPGLNPAIGNFFWKCFYLTSFCSFSFYKNYLGTKLQAITKSLDHHYGPIWERMYLPKCLYK